MQSSSMQVPSLGQSICSAAAHSASAGNRVAKLSLKTKGQRSFPSLPVLQLCYYYVSTLMCALGPHFWVKAWHAIALLGQGMARHSTFRLKACQGIAHLSQGMAKHSTFGSWHGKAFFWVKAWQGIARLG